jgi:hypothetical protein
LLALLERLEERDDVVSLSRIEPEFRHGWMARHKPLGKGLLKILDRILAVERPKRRRRREWTRAQPIDGVARRTVRPREDEAALGRRRRHPALAVPGEPAIVSNRAVA